VSPKLRNAEDRWMPSRVYPGKSAYEWRPKGGGAVRLCALNATPAEVWAAYEKAVAETKTKFDFSALADMYFASPNFTRLKKNTRDDYQRSKKMLIAVFGNVTPSSIKPMDVRHYMDERGKSSTVRANRERSLLSTIMAWAYERGLTDINPCAGVKTFTEKARQRYVSDAELAAALSIMPPQFQAAAQIAYRCAARLSDVLHLTRTQITPDGLYIEQGKTGKRQVKAWTQELRAAVNLGLAQPSRIQSITWVIYNRAGQRYTESGFKGMWRKLIARAVEKNQIAEPFTFHDLKRKGISDIEGDNLQFS
jgi:integrase